MTAQVKPIVAYYKQTGFQGKKYKGVRRIAPWNLEHVIAEDMEIAEEDGWDYWQNKSKFRPVYEGCDR